MNPIARIVCWYCRQGDKQLFRIRDEDGFKTEDYICVNCKPNAPKTPPMPNVSKMLFSKKKPETKTVAIEGDIIT